MQGCLAVEHIALCLVRFCLVPGQDIGVLVARMSLQFQCYGIDARSELEQQMRCLLMSGILASLVQYGCAFRAGTIDEMWC